MFKERNFLFLWLGQVVSIFGGRFSELVIPWMVLQITHSPMKAALVAISTQIAPLFLSLPAGVFIEQSSKKKTAMYAEFIRTVTMTLLVIIIMAEKFNLFLIMTILLVTGLAGLFFRIAFHSLLPMVAGRNHLIDVHNYMEGADAISTLIGPVLAGIALSKIGAAATLGIDAFSFFLSFVSLMLITVTNRDVRNKNEPLRSKELFNQGVEGIKMLFSTRIQRFITLNHLVLHFITHSITLLVIVLAKQNLELSASQTGILLSGAGVGNIIGIFMMKLLKNAHWNLLYGTLLLCSSCGIIIVSFSANLWFAFIGMLLFDGALSMAFVINGAARQTVTPNQFLARVSSGGLLLTGIVVIFANGFAGSVAEWINPVSALLICSCILFLNSVISYRQKLLNRSVASFSVDTK